MKKNFKKMTVYVPVELKLGDEQGQQQDLLYLIRRLAEETFSRSDGSRGYAKEITPMKDILLRDGTSAKDFKFTADDK